MTSSFSSTVGVSPSTAAYQRCIHRVFDDRASATPGAVAIKCGERTWTYAEIAAVSRAFAADLREVGVGPGAVVGIGIGRSMEFVVAVLAVLRCGAAYAPLPWDDPVERLALLVDSAGMTAIVTASADGVSTALLRARPGLVHASISAETPPPLAADDDDHPVRDPEAPAAVMFTSGSTGTPKGVIVPHRAIVGLVTGQSYADFGPGLCTVMAAPTAFDASTFEIWGPLLHGGTVVVYPDGYFDLVRFGEVVRTGRVNCLWLTAALFNHVIDHAPEILSPVRHVLTGGDVVSVAHVRRAFEALPGIRLTNGYGPTETTTFACTHDIDPADTFPHGSIPLGSPLAHTDLLVVSEEGIPLTDGEPGELWIGGSGVAKGYLSGSEAKFVADPRSDGGVGTMYRSGDLCRRLPDGTLLFLGRIDQQVKIRGHRVEPGEVESTLLTHPSLRAAAVLAFTRDEETALAAFVVRRDGSLQPIEGFRGWIEKRLPAAMVPERLVFVRELPLTHNGKLYRKALLALFEADEPSGRGAPPRPGTESILASLWRGVLRGPAPGRDDDFFALGGHSLMAMRLVAAIEREFRVRLPVTAVFETRTLSRLAAAIDAAAADGAVGVVADDVSAVPPIPSSDERLLPALPAQRGMWLLDAFLPDRAAYNQPFAFRPDRPVDWDGLRGALGRAMARHGALRSCLVDRGDGPVQRILPMSAAEVPWAEEPLVDAEGIEEALFDHGRRPFDLGTAPLWRATLFPRAAPHGILLLTFHHAIIDDWSIELLLRELERPDGGGHDADEGGTALAPLSPAEQARCTRFWKETLAGASGDLPWPRRLRPLDAVNEALGGLHRFSIDGDVAAPLRGVAGETGATEFQILLAAFHAWLRRMTGSGDVVVGTPVSLRRSTAEQASIGCFLNTLPVRVRWDGEASTAPSFVDHVRRVGETFLDAVGHGSLPFDEIVSAVVDRRADERSPIVTTLFVATPEGTPSFSRDGVTLAPIPVDTATAKFDLTLFLERDGEGWRGAFEFDRRRFDDATIARFAATFPVFLRAVLTSPAEPVERVSLLSAEARRAMLELGEPADPTAAGGGLIEGFLARVKATPEAIAVRWAGGALRYRELRERSERIAARLRLVGVTIDTPVAICLPRSPELQAAILGVLMAGAGCVPLDPTLPPERLAAMMEVVRCPWVVCDERSAGIVARFRDLIPGGGDSPRPLRIDADDPDGEVAAGPAEGADGRNRLAYILFTSGSTGVPKGVEMPVGPLASLVAWQCRHSVVGPGARTLQFASCGFDVSFQELFSTWLSGGELVIVPEATRLDPVALLELVMDSAVERIFLPVAVLEHLAEAALATARCPQTLREVIVAGEQLRIGPAIRRFFARMPAAILWNQYGPTESHVVTSEILAGDPEDWPDLPAIGRPVAGASIRVLDGSMEPVPVDVAGEIWIGGACLARGYVGRDDLTAERFVDDPFSAEPGRRMYRSGDVGRWRPDGRLEYLGRVDRQVKIRGHRVEPDEVESVLAGHPLVAEAAVVARRDDRGEWFLVAHVVPAAGAAILPSELVGWLAARLPAAMVPERLAVVGELPLTHNGKVDRRLLERMTLPDPTGGDPLRAKPVGETEETLASIWCALLGVPAVGRDDGFFARGGHSLLSMRLVAAIEREFGVRLPIKAVFEAPRLADLAARISTARTAIPDSMEALKTIPAGDDVIECRPLPAQRGMWLLHALLPDPATYNVPVAWRVAGPIDWSRLVRALGVVADRHPALRTALVEIDGELVQRVQPPASVAVPWREARVAGEASLADALREEAAVPFDLAVAPLLRAVRFDVTGGDPVVMVTFHHAIVDEWSIGIIREDLATAYAVDAPLGAGSLPVVTAACDPADFDRQRDFWRTELAGAPPETPLPGSSGTAEVGITPGTSHRFTVDAAVVDRLRHVAGSSGVTFFSLLLASAHAWLRRITGERDLVIGTPVATRGAAETAGAVGCLINVLPVRVPCEAGASADFETLPQFSARVQEIFLRAVDHADLPFHEIVAAAVPVRQGRRQPLVNVLLTVVETGRPSWQVGPASFRSLPIDAGTSRFEVSLTLEVGPDGLAGTLESPAGRFEDEVIAGFVARYAGMLDEVAADPAVPIARMRMLPTAQRRRVIEEFNDTAVDLGSATTLHRLVSDTMSRIPTAIAVREGIEAITYADLDRRAGRLARRLRGLGIGPGQRVGVALPRSIDAIVAMLAVLRAGAAWVPLDREASPARAAFIVSDAGLVAIIGSGDSSGGWPQGIAVVDPADVGPVACPEEVLADVDPGAPAYVMYTSGSTGQPKGVVIPHSAVVNYLRGKQRRFPLESTDVVLHATRTTFDISVYEVFGPLLGGASLVILPAGRTDPAKVAELVHEERVTVVQVVPSLLALLVEDRTFTAAPTVRRVFCGGEAMTAGLMRRFVDASTAELVNVYGPTEATVWATAWVCDRLPRDEAPPIGRPLDNVRCYVLDAAARPVPVGAVGELFIGGDQLAIGYHDRPELTAERFLPDPFADTPGARIYRTGDACRWRHDGVLEFVARTDQQVKIRGHRIEPAEIEACLASHPEITAAAVVAVPMAGDGPTALVAAVVPRGGTLDAEAVRRWVAERLPEVMVPSRIVTLDSLPVNANGKIDRQALAGHVLASSTTPAAGPCDAARAQMSGSVFEAQIRAAWQRVFGRVDFGDEDNFFHHLGGQSIVAARLVADLSAALGRRVPLAAVFEAPTVVAMTALLRHEGWTPRFRSIVPLQPFGDGPPMWLFHGVGGGVSETLSLARAFQPDVPVYALQAVDRDGGVLQESLTAMAELYADEIVAFQPRGPYFLGGFSLGGWFAYEAARQLRLRGRDVALLAQFDTHINCILPEEVLGSSERVMAKEYVWKHLRRIARRPVSLWQVLGKLPARIRLARQWRMADPIKSDRHGGIVANYRAMPYDGAVDYFRSVESLPSVLEVWKRWCPGGVKEHPIPGDHHEIIKGTNAEMVAGIIRGIIRERTGKASAPG